MNLHALRCSDCQVVITDGIACDQCFASVCDDCATNHPCRWATTPEDDPEDEEEEDYNDQD